MTKKNLCMCVWERETWGYIDDIVKSVIANKSSDPGVKIIVSSTYVNDWEIAFIISNGPKLITLPIIT